MAGLVPLDIGNMALDLLTEGQIDSLADDNRPARLLSRHIDVAREAELAKHRPYFALFFPAAITATDTGSSVLQHKYLYAVPEDMLRPMWMTRDGRAPDGNPPGVPITWGRWADGIRSDFEGPLYMPYIGNVVDPDDFDALFTDVFAAQLAIRIAHPLTGKASMIERATQAYDRAVSVAAPIWRQEIGDTLYTGSWPLARGDRRYGRR